jgi:hypothetical protein
MKKPIIVTLVLIELVLTFFSAKAQDTVIVKQGPIYTGVYNNIPENFPIPVIGFVNVSNGHQHNLQLGLTNTNEKSLKGTQVGISNFVGAQMHGAQVGVANICYDSLVGSAVGVINITNKGVTGAQVGCVNINRATSNGAQVGYVNITEGTTLGTQVGFVNVATDTLSGAQVGYVNVVTNDINGTQVGFVNRTKNLNGLQIGFINVADTISNGVPIGFLSVVKRGGFKAIEVGYSNLLPVNFSFKTGVNALYTSFIAGYNPDAKKDIVFLGMGIGSNLPIKGRLFFNPEAQSLFSLEKKNQQVISLNTMFGLTITKNISLLAGASTNWIHQYHKNPDPLYQPNNNWYEHKIDQKNHLNIGLKTSLRINF